MKKLLYIFVAVAALAGGFYAWTQYGAPPVQPGPIGGQRDEHGCLGPAGYAYDETVGACIRSFEMTADIKEAARLAVADAGRGYALTVVSFNSYEEVGAYDIMLERGAERIPTTVYIRGGKVVPPPAQ